MQDLLRKDGMIIIKDKGRICHHTFEHIQGDLVLTEATAAEVECKALV